MSGDAKVLVLCLVIERCNIVWMEASRCHFTVAMDACQQPVQKMVAH